MHSARSIHIGRLVVYEVIFRWVKLLTHTNQIIYLPLSQTVYLEGIRFEIRLDLDQSKIYYTDNIIWTSGYKIKYFLKNTDVASIKDYLF